MIQRAIVSIQQQIYKQNKGLKTDAHYQEGYGAFFVPYGQAPNRHNVLLKVDERQLMFM